MKAVKLAGLEPAPLFAYFEKICSIPHGSRNCKAIGDYFEAFAKEHGLRCIRDAAGNVILFKNGSAGYENHEPLILQAHMDMVTQKEEGCTIDMEKEPIDVTHDGEYIFAKGTTLGADDGCGVAYCLTLLADDSAEHPPLEVIFTADEEIGLVGANQLDLSMLKGRRMINLDGATEGGFVVGCAGGARVALQMPLEKAPCKDAVLSIRLDNLHGGHSGGLIHLNYANANKAMCELLLRIQQTVPFRIVSFAGGTAGNAIPRSCVAELALNPNDVQKVQVLCDAYLAELKNTYEEPEATLCAQLISDCAKEAYTDACSKKLLALLNELPNGMQEWNPKFKIPLTSLNLGIAKTGESLETLSNVRSNVNQNRQQLQDDIKAIAEKYGCQYSESGAYPAWEYREDSPLRDTVTTIFRQLRGKEPSVRVTHAGLECGVIGERLPDLDCVSTGPNMRFIHTTGEKLDIASFGRTYEYLKEVLKAL